MTKQTNGTRSLFPIYTKQWGLGNYSLSFYFYSTFQYRHASISVQIVEGVDPAYSTTISPMLTTTTTLITTSANTTTTLTDSHPTTTTSIQTTQTAFIGLFSILTTLLLVVLLRKRKNKSNFV
ncbi:MAG: hypothetical protein ACFFBD_05805 [Candidatus Hodarchaeota archaeon]